VKHDKDRFSFFNTQPCPFGSWSLNPGNLETLRQADRPKHFLQSLLLLTSIYAVMSSAEVHGIISRLMAGQSSPEEQLHLQNYVDTAQSWGPVLELLSNDSDHIRFFTANIVLKKVRTHWAQLTEQQHMEVYSLLSGLIAASASSYATSSPNQKAYTDRLVLCFAAAGSRIPGNIANTVRSSIEMVKQAETPSDDVNMTEQQIATVGIEILAALPVEIEALEGGRDNRLALQAVLTEAMPFVMTALDTVLVANDPRMLPNMALAGIHLMKAWAANGLSLRVLCGPCVRIYNSLVVRALNSGDPTATREVCLALREARTAPDPDALGTCASMNDSVVMLLDSLAQAWSTLSAFFDPFSASGDEQAAHEVANLLALLGSADAEFLLKAANPWLFEKLLFITTQKPRRLATLTFDVWMSIQEIPTDPRHPFSTQGLFQQLLAVTLKQAALPVAFTDWDSGDAAADDEDDFEEFRSSKAGVDEVLLICYYCLEERFFSMLSDYKASVTAAGGAGEGTADWTTLEVLLFTLTSIMTGMRRNLEEGSPHEVVFVQNALTQLLQYTPEASPNRLVTTGCAFIASATFFVCKPTTAFDMTALILPCVDFCLKALRKPSAAADAAKGILQLTHYGSTLLLGNSDIISGLVSAACLAVADPLVDGEAVLKVLEAVTRIITQLDFSTIDTYVTELLAPIVTALGEACSNAVSGVENGDRVELLLKASSTVMRFCDEKSCNNVSPDGTHSHVLSASLGSMWPILQGITTAPMLLQNEGVIDALMLCYSRAFTSALPLMVPQVMLITQHITGIFQEQSQPSVLACASTIVEAITGDGAALVAGDARAQAEHREYLSYLFAKVVEIFSNKTRSAPAADLWGFTPAGLEHIFKFFYICLICSPDIVSESSALAPLSGLCLLTLNACKERQALREVLKCINVLFLPVSGKHRAYHQALLRSITPHGSDLVSFLLNFIGGGGSVALLPVVIDTLYACLRGTTEAGGDGPLLAVQWMQSAIADPSLLVPLAAQHRSLVFDSAMRHVTPSSGLGQSSGKEEFKRLMVKVSKAGTGGSSVDILLA